MFLLKYNFIPKVPTDSGSKLSKKTHNIYTKGLAGYEGFMGIFQQQLIEYS